MNRPVTRVVPPGQRQSLAALFRGRGHTLATNPKNRYVAFEVRTEGRSIFTLYTSGKLVSTIRADDARGALLEDDVATLLGEAVGPRPRTPPATDESAELLLGADETGTGELLGAAMVGACLLPVALGPRAAELAGHVATKTSRAASGWRALAEGLAGLRADGLHCALLTIPNRLFDRYSKNALLDLAYVRLVANLLAVAGREQAAGLAGLQIVLDDYGAGRLLHGAVDRWRRRGAEVRVETKADDRYLAPRLASVWARAARSREMVGLAAEVDDGPLGSGNAGHPATLAWLRRRVRVGAGWPTFVKTSFKTVRTLDGLQPVTKLPLPPLQQLLDDASAETLLQGRLEIEGLQLPTADGQGCSSLRVDCSGRVLQPSPAPGGAEFLPLLFGGLVLDMADLPLETLDRLLQREGGLLSGWTVLVGPTTDLEDPQSLALARAHAAGVLQLQPTALQDPTERAWRHGGLRLVSSLDEGSAFQLLLDGGTGR